MQYPDLTETRYQRHKKNSHNSITDRGVIHFLKREKDWSRPFTGENARMAGNEHRGNVLGPSVIRDTGFKLQITTSLHQRGQLN